MPLRRAEQFCLLPVPPAWGKLGRPIQPRDNMADVKKRKNSFPVVPFGIQHAARMLCCLKGFSAPSYLNPQLQIILASQWKSFCFHLNNRAFSTETPWQSPQLLRRHKRTGINHQNNRALKNLGRWTHHLLDRCYKNIILTYLFQVPQKMRKFSASGSSNHLISVI